MNKIEALKKIEELKKFIENEDKQERFMPEVGEDYYYVSSGSVILTATYYRDYLNKGYYKMGYMFKTKEEAELHKLKLISMANKWLPEEGKEYFYYDHEDGEVHLNKFNRNDVGDIGIYHIGNTHETEEQAKEWGRTKSKAFEIGRSNE